MLKKLELERLCIKRLEFIKPLEKTLLEKAR